MSQPPFNYTDAHFAAALLACGPHIPERTDGAGRKLIGRDYRQLVKSDVYRERVYKHFFELFPTHDLVPSAVRRSGAHEWFVFWREYKEWVES